MSKARTAADGMALIPMLIEALDALADAGKVDHACRIAGRACMKLRESDPAAARRLDAWLHRMIKRLDW